MVIILIAILVQAPAITHQLSSILWPQSPEADDDGVMLHNIISTLVQDTGITNYKN